MINGFFAMKDAKLPVSQIFKTLILILFFVRLSTSRDMKFILLLLVAFQIGPLFGLFKTRDLGVYLQDVIVATKWLIVPVSFFYFKKILQQQHFLEIRSRLILLVKRAFGFISLNMLLGALGLGMAFYNHGYSNAVGTKGFIYAGNELTISTLAIGFIMATYFFLKEAYTKYLMTLGVFLAFAFLITSKTVLGGVLIVFLIPALSTVKMKIKRKWVDWITVFFFLGIPTLLMAFYIGLTKSGFVDKFRNSLERNDYDILTVLISNRNNFVKQGWEVYMEGFPFVGKIFGYGQQYHLELSGHGAEVDFLSMLFSSGIFGLSFLLLILLYWIINANKLIAIEGYIYAKPVLIFLWFIIIASNLSGHVLGSGIAGFFLGLALALMFYNPKKLTDEASTTT
jgi:hypothetical protein